MSGGYNSTISDAYGNLLAGRNAWSGDSGGYVLTVVNLPAAAAGQVIQLRWRCGTYLVKTSPGWRIDSLVIDGYWCCPDSAPPPPFVPTAGSYSGLFYEPAGVHLGSSGAFSARTTPGSLQRHPANGRQTIPVQRTL